LDYISPNGTYSEWAHNHQNESDHLQTVSEGYFITSTVIFTGGPFLVSLYILLWNFCSDDSYAGKNSPFLFTGNLLNHYRDVPYKTVSTNTCINLITAITFLPIDTIIASMSMNIILPLWSIKTSLKLALTNESNEKTRENILIYKSFEIFLETLPQFVLGFVFCMYNDAFIFDSNPLTIVSVFFSGGSLLLAVRTSNKTCKSFEIDDIL